MSDTQQPTAEQKKTQIIEALGIAGFTENPDFTGIYTQEHGMKKIVVDLTAGTSVYFMENKQKVVDDDEYDTLAKVSKMIVEAEDGRMPARTEADIVVSVPPPDAPDEPTPETPDPDYVPQPDDAQTVAEPTPSTPINVPTVPKPAQALTPANNLLDLIQKYVGDDVLQIFGDTGAGKSKFGLEVARQAIATGKKVYYLDTERNLTDEDVASLTGCEYKYTPVLDEIDSIVRKLPAVDVVVLDSIGFPVLTTYARLSLKQKGDALLQLIAIFGDLKTWAYKNNGVAIVTNQPESEFNKKQGHIFRPFGDKSQFACKEIWKTKIASRSSTETNILINAFRSRSVGFGTKIATMKISDNGVEVVT